MKLVIEFKVFTLHDIPNEFAYKILLIRLQNTFKDKA